MKIMIEVEPVLIPGRYSDPIYYGFKIVGLHNKYGREMLVHAPNAVYPGNDIVREFINARTPKECPMCHSVNSHQAERDGYTGLCNNCEAI